MEQRLRASTLFTSTREGGGAEEEEEQGKEEGELQLDGMGF